MAVTASGWPLASVTRMSAGVTVLASTAESNRTRITFGVPVGVTPMTRGPDWTTAW